MTRTAASDDLILRFTTILHGLRHGVQARGREIPLPALLVTLIIARLNRMIDHFKSIIARAPGRVGRPSRPTTLARNHQPGPFNPNPDPILPRDFDWLIRMIPPVHSRGNPTGFARPKLEALLADPEMQALIASTPAVGRILRPLCRMLGIRPPGSLRLPRRPRQAAEPGNPRRRNPNAPQPFPYPRPPRPPTVEDIKRTIGLMTGDRTYYPHQDVSPPDFYVVHRY